MNGSRGYECHARQFPFFRGPSHGLKPALDGGGVRFEGLSITLRGTIGGAPERTSPRFFIYPFISVLVTLSIIGGFPLIEPESRAQGIYLASPQYLELYLSWLVISCDDNLFGSLPSYLLRNSAAFTFTLDVLRERVFELLCLPREHVISLIASNNTRTRTGSRLVDVQSTYPSTIHRCACKRS